MTTGSGRNGLDLEIYVLHNENGYNHGYYKTRIGNHGLRINCHNHSLIIGKDRTRLLAMTMTTMTVDGRCDEVGQDADLART